jgi:myo-inositol-1(or 4)-monophosphatase
LDALSAFAVRLAERGAAIHKDGRERGFTIAEKSSDADLVTEIDRQAEREIVAAIVAERPDDAILGEEGTERAGSSGVRWVIDPLDGTASFVRGYPGYCVAIGVEIDGDPTIGVVLDSRGVLTQGVLGVGAMRDGRPVAPSERRSLASSVVATGFGYQSDMRARQAQVASVVLPRVADIRRSGSAAFDLVAAAVGEVDAYYEIGLAPWDLCGAGVIVRSAGAVLRVIPQPNGDELTVAAPPQLLDPLLDLLRDAGMST